MDHDVAPPPEPPVTQPDAAPAARPTEPWYASLVRGDLTALWPAIVFAFIGVLAIAFGMSFHGLFVFGEVIMGWVTGLCIAGPIGLDVFSMLALLATFLTRDAAWRIRAYCWLALLGTVALSVTGNAVSAYALLDADAARRGVTLAWGYQQFSAVLGAAFWPALSAIALHVLIVVRRHLDERRDTVRQIAVERDRADAEERLTRAAAIELAAKGTSAADIVKELGLDTKRTRSVERWTEDIRSALAAPRPAVAAKGTSRRAVTARTNPGEN